MALDKSPEIPFKEDYKAIITANKPYLQENKISREYKGLSRVGLLGSQNRKSENEC